MQGFIHGKHFVFMIYVLLKYVTYIHTRWIFYLPPLDPMSEFGEFISGTRVPIKGYANRVSLIGS